MQFKDIHTIYFLGIGGIGMSALARYFKKHGAQVSGYDRSETDLTRALVAEGMAVHYDDNPGKVPTDADLVVWTPAIPADHQELNFIREKGLPLKKRAEVLGIISQEKQCVAVAGTHGKTTTSSMTAYLLRSCGVDASAFLGGIALNLGSNFVEGDSNWVVAEADEYDRSFLHLHPQIAILNSLDPDHLDIYGTPEAIVETYKQFIRQIKPGGTLLYKQGLPLDDVVAELRASGRQAFSFGIDAGDVQAQQLHVADGMMQFQLQTGADWTGTPTNELPISLPYPGRHNVENATAAAAATLLLMTDTHALQTALRNFRGVHRRFEYIVHNEHVKYIDDYAHHPAELEAAIRAARMLYPKQRITGVFQPHLYSRTRDFADAFAAALDLLDTCWLLPIYPARELPIEGVSANMLLDKMTISNKAVLTKEALLQQIQKDQPHVLLTMGAGDIDRLIEPIRQILTKV
ncbi:MAG: UDP-N-acetylmuramate--L-alanine ligase [Lewinellaceae bacterium]|nr:UDP-N-acetylmuramate--L-alanine ligase [Lewinellaceae bacterium]